MTQKQLDEFIVALRNYIRAEIKEATQFSDWDSMGSFPEEEILKDTLENILTPQEEER